MAQRTLIFRYLLVVLLAAWLPVCLCSPAQAAPDQGAIGTRSCSNCHGADDDDGGGCPSQDHRAGRCECAQPLATLTKADLSLHSTVPAAVMAEKPNWGPALTFMDVLAGGPCDRVAVPRPRTSLLRLHCALMV